MKLLNGESITLGTCYYPEHWKEELWEEDLTRMLEKRNPYHPHCRICLEQD